jgi:hypothetical protein
MNTPKGRTPYHGLLGQIPGYSKIAVHDPVNAWYQA